MQIIGEFVDWWISDTLLKAVLVDMFKIDGVFWWDSRMSKASAGWKKTASE